MIDYINIQVKENNISELERNQYLNFCNEVNTLTGEMRSNKRNGKPRIPYKNAYFKGLEFKIYDSGTILLNGSLHVYYNNGVHNFNDFNTQSVIEVLQDIKEKFNINPGQMILRQLEIGINIVPPYPTEQIIKHCYLHGTELFKWVYVSNEGKYIQAEHSQYFIKIYDKARHYRNKGFEVGKDEIMRFEIKFKKLERLKKDGIKTMQDLLNYGMGNYTNILINEWQKVLFYDFTINHDSKPLDNYKNPLFWDELKTRRSAFDKHKRKYRDIVKNHSGNVSLQIENCLREKCNLLSRGTTFDQKCKDEKRLQGTNIDHLYIGSILPPPPIKTEQNICPITGLNISMQRKKSYSLSHTGLKYYYQTDKKIFNEVKRKFLCDKWIGSDFQTQIEEIAHNIRNYKNNRKLKQKRIYPEGQYRMNIFWQNELIPTR